MATALLVAPLRSLCHHTRHSHHPPAKSATHAANVTAQAITCLCPTCNDRSGTTFFDGALMVPDGATSGVTTAKISGSDASRECNSTRRIYSSRAAESLRSSSFNARASSSETEPWQTAATASSNSCEGKHSFMSWLVPASPRFGCRPEEPVAPVEASYRWPLPFVRNSPPASQYHPGGNNNPQPARAAPRVACANTFPNAAAGNRALASTPRDAAPVPQPGHLPEGPAIAGAVRAIAASCSARIDRPTA